MAIVFYIINKLKSAHRMKLTDEQAKVATARERIAVVKAFAGAGKTSTLRAYAAHRPRERLLYVAFNKSVQLEAEKKFAGMKTTPRTSHSLAYEAVGKTYRDKLGPDLKPNQVVEVLRLRQDLMSPQGEMLYGAVVLDTLKSYLASAHDHIMPSHIGKEALRLASHLVPTGVSQKEAVLRVRDRVLEQANALWRRMTDHGDRSVPMTHDGYLKLYQLGKPALPYYGILFDEAQDANPVTLAIVLAQPGSKIFVGDSHQAIYGFRKATDALQRISAIQGVGNYALTGSFRFGPAVAQVANALLALKGEPLQVRGLGGADRIGAIDPNRPYACLCRGNAAVFDHTVTALKADQRWHLIGGVPGYRFGEIEDVHNLRFRKGQVRNPFLASFKDYGELEEYAEQVDDREILAKCKIVRKYGAEIPELVAALNEGRGGTGSSAEAQVVVSTTHKAKGLEFEQVILGEDFVRLNDHLHPPPGAKPEPPPAEELNILYVAATRAQKVLELNSDLKMALGHLPAVRANAAQSPGPGQENPDEELALDAAGLRP